MALNKGTKAAIWLGSLLLFNVILTLCFLIYPYVALILSYDLDRSFFSENNIDIFVFYFLKLSFWGVWAASVLWSAVLLFKGNAQNKKTAIYLLLLCSVLYFTFKPLKIVVMEWAENTYVEYFYQP